MSSFWSSTGQDSARLRTSLSDTEFMGKFPFSFSSDPKFNHKSDERQWNVGEDGSKERPRTTEMNPTDFPSIACGKGLKVLISQVSYGGQENRFIFLFCVK